VTPPHPFENINYYLGDNIDIDFDTAFDIDDSGDACDVHIDIDFDDPLPNLLFDCDSSPADPHKHQALGMMSGYRKSLLIVFFHFLSPLV
jgi:hypothetical protein